MVVLSMEFFKACHQNLLLPIGQRSGCKVGWLQFHWHKSWKEKQQHKEEHIYNCFPHSGQCPSSMEKTLGRHTFPNQLTSCKMWLHKQVCTPQCLLHNSSLGCSWSWSHTFFDQKQNPSELGSHRLENFSQVNQTWWNHEMSHSHWQQHI